MTQALATKKETTSSPIKARPRGTDFLKPKIATQTTPFFPTFQRKPMCACACGGGCARCSLSQSKISTSPNERAIRRYGRFSMLPDRVPAASHGNRIWLGPQIDLVPAHIRRAMITHEVAHVLQSHHGKQTKGRPWTEQRLEDEAMKAGIAASKGETPTIEGIARDNRTRFHPIFISTHYSGSWEQEYLSNAEQYYRSWGYGTPERVGSIEEIVMRLGSGTGPVPRITIVTHGAAHGVAQSLKISFLQGGYNRTSQSDWETTNRLSLPGLSTHTTLQNNLERILRLIRPSAQAQDTEWWYRLRPDVNDPVMRLFVWYNMDIHHVTQTDPGLIPQYSTVLHRLQQQRDHYRSQLISRIMTSEEDVTQLEQAINDVLATQAFPNYDAQTWAALSRRIRSGQEAAVERVLGQPPGDSLFLYMLYAHNRLRDATVEIKACRLGDNTAYLEAMSRFFGPPRRPVEVTASRINQIFGAMASTPHPNTTAHLSAMWSNSTIHDAFLDYVRQTGNWTLNDPPTAQNLIDFLRAGNAFPVGTTLHFLQGFDPPDGVIAWFARLGYRIGDPQAIFSTFFSSGTVTANIHGTVVEYLEDWDQTPVPIFFPYESDYQNQIATVRSGPAIIP